MPPVARPVHDQFERHCCALIVAALCSGDEVVISSLSSMVHLRLEYAAMSLV
jgi:hypothetical protein